MNYEKLKVLLLFLMLHLFFCNCLFFSTLKVCVTFHVTVVNLFNYRNFFFWYKMV